MQYCRVAFIQTLHYNQKSILRKPIHLYRDYKDLIIRSENVVWRITEYQAQNTEYNIRLLKGETREISRRLRLLHVSSFYKEKNTYYCWTMLRRSEFRGINAHTSVTILDLIAGWWEPTGEREASSLWGHLVKNILSTYWYRSGSWAFSVKYGMILDCLSVNNAQAVRKQTHCLKGYYSTGRLTKGSERRRGRWTEEFGGIRLVSAGTKRSPCTGKQASWPESLWNKNIEGERVVYPVPTLPWAKESEHFERGRIFSRVLQRRSFTSGC